MQQNFLNKVQTLVLPLFFYGHSHNIGSYYVPSIWLCSRAGGISGCHSIILFGHAVTIPTILAIAETQQLSMIHCIISFACIKIYMNLRGNTDER